MKKIQGIYFLIFLITCVSIKAQTVQPYKAENGKYGLKISRPIDDSIILQPVYDTIYYKTIKQVSKAYYFFGLVKDGKVGLATRAGKILAEPVYDLIKDELDLNVKLIGVRKGSFATRKYGMINLEGKEVIKAKYDYFPSVFSSEEKIASAKLNGKYGFIDTEGKEVIPFIYEQAGVFINGLADVKLNGDYGFINPAGKMVIKNNYEAVKHFFMGLAAVKKKGKWGYIDEKGKTVISFKYKTAGDFNPDTWNGAKAYVIPLKENAGFYIDKAGKKINN